MRADTIIIYLNLRRDRWVKRIENAERERDELNRKVDMLYETDELTEEDKRDIAYYESEIKHRDKRISNIEIRIAEIDDMKRDWMKDIKMEV